MKLVSYKIPPGGSLSQGTRPGCIRQAVMNPGRMPGACVLHAFVPLYFPGFLTQARQGQWPALQGRESWRGIGRERERERVRKRSIARERERGERGIESERERERERERGIESKRERERGGGVEREREGERKRDRERERERGRESKRERETATTGERHKWSERERERQREKEEKRDPIASSQPNKNKIQVCSRPVERALTDTHEQTSEVTRSTGRATSAEGLAHPREHHRYRIQPTPPTHTFNPHLQPTPISPSGSIIGVAPTISPRTMWVGELLWTVHTVPRKDYKCDTQPTGRVCNQVQQGQEGWQEQQG